ncbi:hypothetical protein [Aliarcobacter butzleri]|uniref:hypothetical protein n=1 Tax=Aliarcobacter butzleri TaxID=28197 RepID=UPI0021B6A5D0|nr:hypothetical protein [Aliarcobacter butzleri]MCT7588230.1 hypothetical protein [Aliarcobacter butzleri]
MEKLRSENLLNKLRVHEERLKNFENRKVGFEDDGMQEITIKLIKEQIERIKQEIVEEDKIIKEFFNIN